MMRMMNNKANVKIFSIVIATVFIIAWDRQRQIKRDVLKKLNKKEIV